MRKNKLLLLLALLLTAATGAWAQTETLLTTITATGKGTYSETTTGVVTVTHDNSDFYGQYGWVWWSNPGSVTVVANEGYTITKCVFYQDGKTIATISTSPFKVNFIYNDLYERYLCEETNPDSGVKDGVSSIEVFGAAPAAPSGYTVSMKDDVKDADKWTVKVGEGQAQALPIGGLKGDGSETVTLQYNGRLKVKGVKATSDAAPAAPASTPLDNTTTAWTAGTFAVPAGGLTYSDAITVSGDVTLTLTDGETLTLNKGISLASGATLTVQGNGTMNVNGTDNSTASTVAGSGTLVLTSGTLNATGGNGADAVGTGSGITANAGGVAINGAVTVSGGTLTATGGNGGSITGQYRMNCKGGAGGAAISGALTINGGTVTTTNGTNGSVGSGCFDCTAGAGGAAAAGGVTDNR